MDPNSLLIWYPKTSDLGIPTPRTYAVMMDDPNFLQRVSDFAAIIGYPVFIRTDLCSGKHGWKDTCFVQNMNELENHIASVCEANEMWSLIGLPYSAIVIREFLEMESTFTAFHGDMPINKERRYFINQGKMVCHHPYWPADAFESGHPSRLVADPDWRQKLEALNAEDEQEIALLTEYANRIGEVMPEYWSVDFAKTKNGKWYLIDMALGKNSFHWAGCEKRMEE